MEREDRKRRIVRAAKKLAHSLMAQRKKPYRFGKNYCIVDGEPCCVFGEVLRRAGPGEMLFPELEKEEVVVGNPMALAFALDCKLAEIPEHVREAANSISTANDHDDWTDRQKSVEVADRLFYFADVFLYSEFQPAAS